MMKCSTLSQVDYIEYFKYKKYNLLPIVLFFLLAKIIQGLHVIIINDKIKIS